jgi:hypothetical protein
VPSPRAQQLSFAKIPHVILQDDGDIVQKMLSRSAMAVFHRTSFDIRWRSALTTTNAPSIPHWKISTSFTQLPLSCSYKPHVTLAILVGFKFGACSLTTPPTSTVATCTPCGPNASFIEVTRLYCAVLVADREKRAGIGRRCKFPEVTRSVGLKEAGGWDCSVLRKYGTAHWETARRAVLVIWRLVSDVFRRLQTSAECWAHLP